MPIQIPIPSVAYEEIEVSLAGTTYNFVFRFNTRWKKYEDDEGTWVIDILNSRGEEIVKGLAIIDQNFLIDPLILPEFRHGDLVCVRVKKTNLAPSRNNVGIGKDYLLVYMSNQEIVDAQS